MQPCGRRRNTRECFSARLCVHKGFMRAITPRPWAREFNMVRTGGCDEVGDRAPVRKHVRFKRRGVPIDGLSLSNAHRQLESSVASLAPLYRAFHGSRLQVRITEIDVRAPLDDKGNAAPGDLVRQANVYGDIVTACLSHPGCEAIQLWGFAGKYSSVGSHTNHRQALPCPSMSTISRRRGMRCFQKCRREVVSRNCPMPANASRRLSPLASLYNCLQLA